MSVTVHEILSVSGSRDIPHALPCHRDLVHVPNVRNVASLIVLATCTLCSKRTICALSLDHHNLTPWAIYSHPAAHSITVSHQAEMPQLFPSLHVRRPPLVCVQQLPRSRLSIRPSFARMVMSCDSVTHTPLLSLPSSLQLASPRARSHHDVDVGRGACPACSARECTEPSNHHGAGPKPCHQYPRRRCAGESSHSAKPTSTRTV
jgi:hypothetical protein